MEAALADAHCVGRHMVKRHFETVEITWHKLNDPHALELGRLTVP